MDISHAIILALVEGLTEFLPISSTGHLILISAWLGIEPTEFTKTFDIIIQLGAILAVWVLYAKMLAANPGYWKKLLIAFLPTGLIGFLVYPWVKSILLEHTLTTTIALGIGGIVLILVDHGGETQPKTTIGTLSTSKLLAIGLFQALAIVPGVSRAAATIIGGRLIGLSRQDAVLFSFLLAIPTMVAASGWDIVQSYQHIDVTNLPILILGCIVAFGTAMLSIKFFLSVIKSQTLAPFGWYRIGIALLFAAMVR